MPRVRFCKIVDDDRLKIFHEKFCNKISYEVPIGYFKSGECYGLYVGKDVVAGFCIVRLPAFDLRSLKQVPFFSPLFYKGEFIYNIAEFTGYFIDSKTYAFRFTVNLVKTIILCPAKYYVYSYPVYQRGLSQYYAKGKPIQIYSGRPKKLDGHPDNLPAESVEVLTKWGIFMIFWYRTKKYLRL
jgi:hypothetical protein